MSTDDIGDLAAAHAIVIHELSRQHASLEAAFMELTRDSIEYRANVHPAAASKESAA